MNNAILKPGLAALGGVIGLLSVAGIAQDNGDIERKLRELNIMNNIFEAALEENNQSGFRMRQARRPDSMYLAGQGMVFSFRLLNNRAVRIIGQGFGAESMNYLEDVLEITRESLEQLQETFPDIDLDFDLDEDMDYDIDTAYNFNRVFVSNGQAIPQPPGQPFLMNIGRGPEREAMQEMEEAMREIQEDIRDQQREIRQLQRELRDDEADITSIEENINSLETEMEAGYSVLEEQRQAYESFVLGLENARLEQQVALAEETSDEIITTLCDYGATLRSLGSNEHVTIILEDVTENNDQVFVFDYADINDCRSAQELKQNAVSYMIPDD